MGAYLNGQKVSRPYLNGDISNIILGDVKIWRNPNRALILNGDQYIDTGYTANQNTRIETAFIFTNNGDLTDTVIGDNQNSSRAVSVYHVNGASNNRFGARALSYAWQQGQKYVISIDKNGFNINGVQNNFASPAAAFTTIGTLLIGAYRNSYAQVVSCMTGKIFYLNIYENDVKVREFYPVKIGETWGTSYVASDCMYDFVTHSLFTNLGSPEFDISEMG
jgi:hypothetical protein